MRQSGNNVLKRLMSNQAQHIKFNDTALRNFEISADGHFTHFLYFMSVNEIYTDRKREKSELKMIFYHLLRHSRSLNSVLIDIFIRQNPRFIVVKAYVSIQLFHWRCEVQVVAKVHLCCLDNCICSGVKTFYICLLKRNTNTLQMQTFSFRKKHFVGGET